MITVTVRENDQHGDVLASFPLPEPVLDEVALNTMEIGNRRFKIVGGAVRADGEWWFAKPIS